MSHTLHRCKGILGTKCRGEYSDLTIEEVTRGWGKVIKEKIRKLISALYEIF
jgi:hypothetical protein